MSRKRTSVFSLVLAVAFSIAAGWLFFNRQFVVDQLAVWQYEPTAQVAAIVEQSAMSNEGEFLFYASKPAIQEAEKFNESCGGTEKNVATLGCYTNYRIFVYDVANKELEGIKTVTSAHEMLHAVYQRLDTDEKTELNKLLETEYEELKDNPRFSERMAVYAEIEPGERANELHSIIGTEVSEISGALEDHYDQYFTDRQVVVSLHNSYASVFNELQQQADALAKEIEQLNQQLRVSRSSYEADRDALNADIAAFNENANSGGFSTRTEFEQERSSLVARSEQLNNRREAINATTSLYNEKVKTFNELSVRVNSLYQSIDSKLEPSPAL